MQQAECLPGSFRSCLFATGFFLRTSRKWRPARRQAGSRWKRRTGLLLFAWFL